MDIFELLKNDHDKIKDILENMANVKMTAKKSRQNLFEKAYKELDIHMRAEEDVFYPVLLQYDEAREKMYEALEEHHIVRLLMDEIKGLDSDDERWDAKAMVLKGNVELHITQEEETIFDLCLDLCDEDQLQQLVKNFQNDKKQIKAHVKVET